MSSNFRCELTFPLSALDDANVCVALKHDIDVLDDELEELRAGNSGSCEMLGPDFDHPGLLCAGDGQASNGEFQLTERALYEAGFAFDARAEGFMEILPEHRYWRPGMLSPAVLLRTADGDAYTITKDLRESIARTVDKTDPGEIRAEFERLANRSDPSFEPISSFASETPMVVD